MQDREIRLEFDLMTATETERAITDPMSSACEMVGRFLYHFSRIELGLDEAIAKLFKLEPGAAEIITANVDFSRKVNLLATMVELQAPDMVKDWNDQAQKLFNAIRGLNDPHRQTLAHSRFEPEGSDAVRFIRVVAKGKLSHKEPVWTRSDFLRRYEEMQRISDDLSQLTAELRPYVPSLDFSDPRNSMYLGLV
jgi:hypothetical protein